MRLRIFHFSYSTVTLGMVIMIVTIYLIRFVYLGDTYNIDVQEKDVHDGLADVKYNSKLMLIGKHCQELHFANPPLPTTALVGPPGSGNTWVRHLLQEATGIFTGSVYHDAELRKEFPAEGVTNGSVIVVKSHISRILPRIVNCSRVILLVRNPFRTAFANYHRRLTGGNHTGIVPADVSESKKIGIKYPKTWYNFILDWLENWTGPMLIVSYENLKKDTIKEMKRILDFLALKVSDENLYCMHQNSEGAFHRKPLPLTPETFKNITDIIRGFAFYTNKLNEELYQRFDVKIDDSIPFELINKTH